MLDRRTLLKGIAAVSVGAGALSRRAAAESHEKDDEQIVDFLFVQNAQGVSLDGGRLRLKGVAPETIYFSDRPDRIVGRITTKEYVDHWAVGGNSFAEEPPNAVLSVHHQPQPVDVVVVLRNPRLEGADLLYDVEVLDGDEKVQGEDSALFIDVIGRPATPLSVAGVRRRTRRRTRRRVARRY